MDELLFFLKGVALGLAIAAPLGPVGALCISRTLQRGFWAGLAGGLGTALADGAYAALAAAGFAAFAHILDNVSVPLRLVGGAFMLWLGISSFKPRPVVAAASIGAGDLLRTTASTFVLTITNPATVLSFAAIFAGLGLAGADDRLSSATVVAGVFSGSMLWWLILAGSVALLHKRLPAGFSMWVARIAGAIMILFGVLAFGSVIYGWVAG